MSIFNKTGNEILSVYGYDGSELDYAYDANGSQIFSKAIPPSPQYEIGLNLLHSSYPGINSPQGMATYGGYIFQFFSNVDTMNIYRMDDFSLVNSISCTVIGHGNSLQFGKAIQSNGFPLLYCSGVGGGNMIKVISIDLNDLSLVDTINLPDEVSSLGSNTVIDFDNELIYVAGYTGSTIYAQNNYKISVLDLNNPSTVISSWQVPYLGVCQGVVWDGAHIVVNGNTYSGSKVKFTFINPQTHNIDLQEEFDKEHVAPLDSEYQGFSFEQNYYLVSKWVYKDYPVSRSMYYEFYSYVPNWEGVL